MQYLPPRYSSVLACVSFLTTTNREQLLLVESIFNIAQNARKSTIFKVRVYFSLGGLRNCPCPAAQDGAEDDHVIASPPANWNLRGLERESMGQREG